jgi:hypothetical protein
MALCPARILTALSVAIGPAAEYLAQTARLAGDAVTECCHAVAGDESTAHLTRPVRCAHMVVGFAGVGARARRGRRLSRSCLACLPAPPDTATDQDEQAVQKESSNPRDCNAYQRYSDHHDTHGGEGVPTLAGPRREW